MSAQDTNIFQRLRAAIPTIREIELRIKEAPKEFPVGTLLPDIWTDPKTGIEYKMPHRVVSYITVRLTDGRKGAGAVLCRVNTLPECREFDKESPYFAESSLWKYLNLDMEDGYLAGCSSELLNVMTEVKSGESFWGDSRIVCGKVFVPCCNELGLRDGYLDSDRRQCSWAYYKFAPSTMTRWCTECKERIFYDPAGGLRNVWTRTRYADSVRTVVPNGFSLPYHPSVRRSILPFSVVVGADVEA